MLLEHVHQIMLQTKYMVMFYLHQLMNTWGGLAMLLTPDWVLLQWSAWVEEPTPYLEASINFQMYLQVQYLENSQFSMPHHPNKYRPSLTLTSKGP